MLHHCVHSPEAEEAAMAFASYAALVSVCIWCKDSVLSVWNWVWFTSPAFDRPGLGGKGVFASVRAALLLLVGG